MLSFLIISVLAAYGMAIALVEKGRQWPIRRYRLILTIWLSKVHPRFPRMLVCPTCTSFWTALVADILLLVLTGFSYWAWPLSGFVAVGFTWSITEFFNYMNRLTENTNTGTKQ